MSWNDIPEGGRALLALGGVVLAGLIICEIIPDDEPPREARKSTSRKGNSLKLTKEESEAYKMGREFSERNSKQNYKQQTQTRKFLIEVPPPRQTTSISRSDTVHSVIRKYPDHYYGLSKNQQFKFRKRNSQQQTEPPNNV